MNTQRSFPLSRWTVALWGMAVLAGAPAQAAPGPQAYISNQSGNVSVIDLATLEVTGEIEAYGKEPRGIGLTADGKLLVTANRGQTGIDLLQGYFCGEPIAAAQLFSPLK